MVEHSTLYPGELDLLQGSRGANRLRFSVLHKHLLWKTRFPSGRSEKCDEAIEFLATRLG